MLATFFIRALSVLVIATSNSLSSNPNNYVIYHVLFHFSLPFGMLYNFLLKVGHLVSGNGSQGKQAFSVRIYGNLIRSWVVFNIRSSYRYQRLQITLMYLAFWPSLLTLELSYVLIFKKSYFTCNPLLYFSPICVALRCGERLFYNLLIKSQILSGPAYHGYDLYKYLSTGIAFHPPPHVHHPCFPTPFPVYSVPSLFPWRPVQYWPWVVVFPFPSGETGKRSCSR